MKKKLFALALCVIMVVAMAAPAFADSSFNTSGQSSLLPFVSRNARAPIDTDHGYHFRRESDYFVPHTVLNCHTDSPIVPSGTKVSLWPSTGHASQNWYSEWTDSGDFSTSQAILRPSSNRALALQANRSYIGIACDVLPSSGNIFNDYNITISGDLSTLPMRVRLNVPARYNHINPAYVTENGVGSYCTWNYYNGSVSQIWYMADGPAKES